MELYAHRYPVFGRKREYKWALEDYWSGKSSREELITTLQRLEKTRINHLSANGMTILPAGDFHWYDFMLDLSLALGVVPSRFRRLQFDHWADLYFAMARGVPEAPACEMTKWFNTNYHYIVPEFESSLAEPVNIFAERVERARALSQGRKVAAVLVGPYTFLALSKYYAGGEGQPALSSTPDRLIAELISRYSALLTSLAHEGADLFIVDEPAMVLDSAIQHRELIRDIYSELAKENTPLWVLTYYEAPADPQTLFSLPVAGVGIDLRDGDSLQKTKALGFPDDKVLIAGIVHGRQVIRHQPATLLQEVEQLLTLVPEERLVLASSCPMLHLPHTLEDETNMPGELRSALAFADERLTELRSLPRWLKGETPPRVPLPPMSTIAQVREELDSLLNRKEIGRDVPFHQRYALQVKALSLPLLPTTTIGSFPQTAEVRRHRRQWKNGKLPQEKYNRFIAQQIEHCIRTQEQIGLDVLVHGEFERSDMVEFFAEQLDGFALTENGWVQSYGSRGIRPPIIYGDVRWRQPMTTREILHAQSLTPRPVKGMLTGPVTIVQWSFVREGLSREEIAYQVALALRKEIDELVRNGIRVIQIDEPAFREALPLRTSQHPHYFEWAVRAFRLTHEQVPPHIQIHTHMCYSEFGDIYDAIVAMDADVLLIEASRSKGEIIHQLKGYPNAVGPGVYDIHSPRIPPKEEIALILRRAMEVIPAERLWVNPDCGLKTRQWEEVIPSLTNMVEVARSQRHALATSA